MAGNNSIQFLRGTSAQRKANSQTLLAGQPFYETDTYKLYVGTGYPLSSGFTTTVNPEYLHIITFKEDSCQLAEGKTLTLTFRNNSIENIYKSQNTWLNFVKDFFDAFTNYNLISSDLDRLPGMIITIPMSVFNTKTNRPEEYSLDYSISWYTPGLSGDTFYIGSTKLEVGGYEGALSSQFIEEKILPLTYSM